jgi:hypothetical protein
MVKTREWREHAYWHLRTLLVSSINTFTEKPPNPRVQLRKPLSQPVAPRLKESGTDRGMHIYIRFQFCKIINIQKFIRRFESNKILKEVYCSI